MLYIIACITTNSRMNLSGVSQSIIQNYSFILLLTLFEELSVFFGQVDSENKSVKEITTFQSKMYYF